MRRSREQLLPFLLLTAVCLCVFLLMIREEHATSNSRVFYEDLALQRLTALAEAQQAFHVKNRRYGWADELAAAGLLADWPTHEEGLDVWIESPGYRIDILLPHTRTSKAAVAVALRSVGRRNAEMESGHFSLVARPWGEARTGFRSFCTDETGGVYISEGISDAASMESRPLPELHLSATSVLITGGMRWYPIDDLPNR